MFIPENVEQHHTLAEEKEEESSISMQREGGQLCRVWEAPGFHTDWFL